MPGKGNGKGKKGDFVTLANGAEVVSVRAESVSAIEGQPGAVTVHLDGTTVRLAGADHDSVLATINDRKGKHDDDDDIRE